MKKIFAIIFIFVFCALLPPQKVYAENGLVVKVLYSTINAYSSINCQSEIVAKYDYGTKLTVVNNEIIVGEDSLNYYKIQVSNTLFGYVLCSQVQNIEEASPTKTLEYNASLNKQAVIYKLQNNSLVATEKSLPSGQMVKLLDAYKEDSSFSLIQFKNQEGEIENAYIHTHCLRVSGISKGTVSAILLIITTVSLILIIFGIKGKRKKKN